MAESIGRYFLLMPVNRRLRPSQRLWCPAADVYRTNDGWIVKVDLAGVNAEDIEVSLSDRTLVISGVRRDASCGEGVTTYRLEITYSRFEKAIRFPCNIEDAHLARDYRDGLLILHLRRSNTEDCD